MSVQILQGDCRQLLADLDANSIDAVVSDPPAGIAFMGREWDHNKGGREHWVAWLAEVMAECQRVMKPGAHALIWALPRTSHWTATAIEDAGFEIRDVITHMFGSGFPKGMRIDNAMIKEMRRWLSTEHVPFVEQVSGFIRLPFVEEREPIALASARIQPGGDPVLLMQIGEEVASSALMAISLSELQLESIGSSTTLSWSASSAVDYDLMRMSTIATASEITTIRAILKSSQLPSMHASITQGEMMRNGRKWIACSVGGGLIDGSPGSIAIPALTALGSAFTNPAKRHEGFNVALKPANEHWILARKPFTGSVAANVQEWATGAINVDACRVPTNDTLSGSGAKPLSFGNQNHRPYHDGAPRPAVQHDAGRWPTNLLLDPAAAEMVDEQSGVSKGRIGMTQHGSGTNSVYGTYARSDKSFTNDGIPDSGGASRFYPVLPVDDPETLRFLYQAKPSRAERNAGLEGMPEQHIRRHSGGEYAHNSGSTNSSKNGAHSANHHPTVKSVALMRWLVRLITPPGGTVLDMFAGSGTTGVACVQEGVDAVLMEQEAEYVEIIRRRVAHAEAQGRQLEIAS